jgi:hypothetical protein
VRHRLQHDPILVGLGVDRGDLPLAEGVVERIVDHLQRHAQTAGELAVDHDIHPQPVVLCLGNDVAQHAR